MTGPSFGFRARPTTVMYPSASASVRSSWSVGGDTDPVVECGVSIYASAPSSLVVIKVMPFTMSNTKRRLITVIAPSTDNIRMAVA
jgi:hypothetical protein